MIEAIIYITIGAFMAWNLPQPEWAKNIQSKILSYFRNRGSK